MKNNGVSLEQIYGDDTFADLFQEDGPKLAQNSPNNQSPEMLIYQGQYINQGLSTAAQMQI